LRDGGRNRLPFGGQFLQRRADEDADPLIGGSDHDAGAATFRHRRSDHDYPAGQSGPLRGHRGKYQVRSEIKIFNTERARFYHPG
jgi:hypothetical protein